MSRSLPRGFEAEGLLRAMPSAVALFDAAGKCLWENDPAERSFADDPRGRPGLVERCARAAEGRKLLEDTQGAPRLRREILLETADGTRWSLLDVVRLPGGELLVSHLDIDVWRRAELALREAKELAERSSQAKTDFLANMSHEIRTPMNGVLGAVELLARSGLGRDQARLVDIVQSSAGLLMTVLDDVLDLARVEAGMLKLERTPFDLGEMLASVLNLHAHRAERSGVRLLREFDPGLPARIMGDPHRLAQVVGNLVGNALKFTEEGQVYLRAEVLTLREDQAVIEVSVEDTGCGIDDAQLSRIFVAFAQADDSITRRFGGTGLGLTISQKILRLMGGGMSVTSELGRGSTFSFAATFDLAPEESEISEAELSAPNPQFRGARILLVEDNPVNREVALEMLQVCGHEVECAENGAQALVKAQTTTYDVILMDCQMPVLDGYTATELIRDAEMGSGQHVPIVALTANAMSHDRERCAESGMDDFLAKPFALDELLDKVAKWADVGRSDVRARRQP
ncbi:MAG: response regulator [Myxococcota bacterium]